MRLLIVLFSVISLFICGIYEKNYFDLHDPIKWHERNHLYVNDFTHLLKPFESDLHHKYVPKDSIELLSNYAWISSDIVFKYLSESDSTDIAVFTVFNPQKSYYHNKADSANRNLITHEEYHFHITEAVTRKVRREILASLDTLTNDIVRAILDSNGVLMHKLGDDYDNFANHGAIELKQIQYQSKIDSMLAQYSAYSDPYLRNYKKPTPPIFRK